MINVVCVKWGTKYGPEYVNRLQRMVHKNLISPHKFFCYTDNPTGVNCETIEIPKYDDLEIYWNKLGIFKQNLFKGKCLYFDLDVVIQNNIDEIVNYTNNLTGIYTYWNDTYTDGEYPYATLKWKVPFNSSVLAWNAEDYYWIWDKFYDDKDWFIIKYFGDDKFLGNEVKDKKTFPKDWIYSRLYGRKEHEQYTGLVKKYEGCYEHVFYFSDYKICIFNGPTDERHYKGFEKYWK